LFDQITEAIVEFSTILTHINSITPVTNK